MESLDYDILWNEICSSFPILNTEDEVKLNSDEEFRNVAKSIKEQELSVHVEELVLKTIEESISKCVTPAFWSKFEKTKDENGFENFRKAVESLYDSLNLYFPVIERLGVLRNISGTNLTVYGENNIGEIFKAIIRSSLHSQLPFNFSAIVEEFYKVSFKVFCNSCDEKTGDTAGEDGLQCSGCCLEIELCQCKKILALFHRTNRLLLEMGLLERVAGDVITSLIHIRIENHVHDCSKGTFDVSFIKPLEDWLEKVVMGWLVTIYNGGPEESSTTPPQKVKDKFKQKLSLFMYQTYTKSRIDELFNMIIEYPDSQPAVEDLRICLLKTDLGRHLTQKLQNAIETRMLHPGVNTPDVLTAYISAIKTLRHLDPTGVLLESVTQPVKHYLKWREDTVRCVVSSLIEEGPNELADELAKGRAYALDSNSAEDEDTENWESWMPEPVEPDPSKPPNSKKDSDIISMLVNVNGSKEMFVNEYRTLLADRLLALCDYNTEKEIRYLELLKLRFGESHFHFCDVMLKDIYDSKRINNYLLSESSFNFQSMNFRCTSLILSAQFWPVFKDELLILPEYVTRNLQIYTEGFEKLKGNRTLSWKPNLGSVNLDVELKDRTLNFTVSPILAMILWHFQKKGQRSVEELSKLTGAPCTVLRRKIYFWQAQGVLKEISSDVFEVIEETESSNKGASISEVICDDEAESAMASAEDQREEELQVFWSYIVGMLTNLDSLPLERIHQMLKMFATQSSTAVDCSIEELHNFLERKVREQKLVFTSGFYKLPK